MAQNGENMIDPEYASLTEIGRRFAVSSRVCGSWLAELGLRVVAGEPTEKARSLGLTTKVPTGRGDGDRQFYIWHLQKTVMLLEAAGHKQVQLTQQPAVISRNLLVGPFSYRSSGGNNWELLNGDGHVFSWDVGEESVPKFIVYLLNLAYKHGKLPPPQG
jgi:hypothetical protein